MTDLPIDEKLFEALREIAEREGRSTEEIANSLLRQYVTSHHFLNVRAKTTEDMYPVQKTETRDPFFLIAQAADELGASSEKGNISELSREILTLELPEYLMRRLNEQADDGTDE